ncbi:MAG: MBOAT family O-acyltransferase [Phototrophicaceae bacterium]
MSFVSPLFFLFCLVVFPTYFMLPHRYRWVLLLISSIVFYSVGNGWYVMLLLTSTLVDYWLAVRIDQSSHPSRRWFYLAISLILNFGVIFTFKYLDFFNQSLASLVTRLGYSYQPTYLNWVLPVGISFYTFQEMSYVVDVFRRKIPAEHHLGRYATYVAFFPQLVAGPIERASNLLPQFNVPLAFNYQQASTGLRLILWGFIKKVVIADRLALYVNAVYGDVNGYGGWQMILATFFFAFQIYCDFSGYSDIAIGLAKIMGFEFMVNFRQPYFAHSLRDFWRRWHISLSTWFRDYVYFPLGGNRVPFLRGMLNLWVVFLLSGLWHGASWTFIIWGAWHGFIITLESVWTRFIPSAKTQSTWLVYPLGALQVLLTFMATLIGWVFFRAQHVGEAFAILKQSLQLAPLSLNELARPFPADEGVVPLLHTLTAPFHWQFSSTELQLVLSFVLIAMLLIYDGLAEYVWQKDGRSFTRIPLVARWATYYVGVLMVLFLGAWGNQSFIYFQF